MAYPMANDDVIEAVSDLGEASQEQEGVGVLYEEEEGSNDFLADGYISQQLEKKNKQREEEEEREKDWKEQFGMGYSEIQSKRSASTSKTSKISKKVRFSKKKSKKTHFLNYKDKNKIFIKIYLQRKDRSSSCCEI